MPPFLRFLGLGLIANVGTRLPNRTARSISAVILIIANLLPLWAVWRGELGVGDVFVIYWLENVVVWLLSIIRICTSNGDATRFAQAAFFAFHYGLFTFVHGAFALILALLSGGFKGTALYWILAVAMMLVSHLVSLGLNWFGQGERRHVTPGQAMALPYPRMLVLHGAVIGAFFFLGGPDGRATDAVGAVALLCGLKLAVDLGFHIWEHLRHRPRPQLAQ